MARPCCRNCRFSIEPPNSSGGLGYCRLKPPNFERLNVGATGTFTPVHLDDMWCGQHRRRPFWWKWFGPKS